MRQVHREPVWSDQPGLFQIVIGLDDFAQLVLGARIAAVEVGVVQFHLLLEPRLDHLARGGNLKIERLQGLAFERLERAPAGLGLRPFACTPGEEIVRIVHTPTLAGLLVHVGARAVRPGIGTCLPGGPMADDAVFLIGRDLVVAPALEIIVRGVELADVVHAEEVILSVEATMPRRPVLPGVRATLPVTARQRARVDLRLVAAYAHTVEIF